MVQDIYDQIKQNFSKLIDNRNFWKEKVVIKTRILEPKEAIGNPERTDFPLLKGKERIIQADFKGSNGQAFTDMYGNFSGRLSDIAEMELKDNLDRAIFVSTLNAVMRYLRLIDKSMHCKRSFWSPKSSADRSWVNAQAGWAITSSPSLRSSSILTTPGALMKCLN